MEKQVSIIVAAINANDNYVGIAAAFKSAASQATAGNKPSQSGNR